MLKSSFNLKKAALGWDVKEVEKQIKRLEAAEKSSLAAAEVLRKTQDIVTTQSKADKLLKETEAFKQDTEHSCREMQESANALITAAKKMLADAKSREKELNARAADLIEREKAVEALVENITRREASANALLTDAKNMRDEYTKKLLTLRNQVAAL